MVLRSSPPGSRPLTRRHLQKSFQRPPLTPCIPRGSPGIRTSGFHMAGTPFGHPTMRSQFHDRDPSSAPGVCGCHHGGRVHEICHDRRAAVDHRGRPRRPRAIRLLGARPGTKRASGPVPLQEPVWRWEPSAHSLGPPCFVLVPAGARAPPTGSRGQCPWTISRNA